MSPDGNPTVLVVDDVDANVRLLEAMLAPHGYDVLAARDGVAAMELVESARPDLVLLDVVMPGSDGFEVRRAVRSGSKAGRTTPRSAA